MWTAGDTGSSKGWEWKQVQDLFHKWNEEARQKERDLQYSEYLKNQVGGDHYTCLGIQPWEYIEANGLDFWEGNVIKYITRNKGNRLEDLQKARHYLDYLIEREMK